MNMEATDVAILWASIGLLIGLIGGHKLGKLEGKGEYERGYLDCAWKFHSESIKAYIAAQLAARNHAAGGRSGADQVVR